MRRTLRFFKLTDPWNEGWYADVPGHTLEENQMVSGSDDFLEEMSQGKDEVFISFAEVVEWEPFIAKLIMKQHDSCGATYILTGPLAREYGAEGFEMWICNVTHDVMGEHPRSIYIFDIH